MPAILAETPGRAGAAALLVGRVGLTELTDTLVRRADIVALMGRVRGVDDPREDPITGYAPHDQLSIICADGTHLHHRVSDTPISPDNPLSRSEIHVKLGECLSFAGSSRNADECSTR